MEATTAVASVKDMEGGSRHIPQTESQTTAPPNMEATTMVASVTDMGGGSRHIPQRESQTTGPPNMEATTVVASVTDMGGGSRHIPQTESQTTGPPNKEATTVVASVTDMGGGSRHIAQTESQTTGPPNMEATTVVASVTDMGGVSRLIPQTESQTTGQPNMEATTVVTSVTDMGGGSRHILQTESQTTGPPNMEATTVVASVTDMGGGSRHIPQTESQTTGQPNTEATTVVTSVTDMGGGSRHIPQTESQTTGPPNMEATTVVASVTDMGGGSRQIPRTESQTTGPSNIEATTVVASVTRSGELGHVPQPGRTTSLTYYAARGENVTLECHFTVPPEDLDQLTIEWLFRPGSGQIVPISFFGDTKYHKNGTQDRVRFSSPNPQDGDASLTLDDLELTDTGTYQCTIKAMTQIQSKKFVLKVMEKLPTPVCGLYSDVEEGKELILTCRISPDILPRRFRWERMTGNRRLPQPAFFYGLQGDLYIKEVKTTDFGTYRCTTQNPVSEEKYCEVILTTAVLTPIAVRERGLEPHVITLPAPNSATSVVIAVAVVTSAMVIIVIIITVVIFEYCKRKPHCEVTDERPSRQEKCIADAAPKGDPEYISLYKMGRKKTITCEGDNQGIVISEEWYV
ncbi:uncharacterized protein LOC131457015 [Solea solea]|uniref:uncharacterized protein LOC131457015 n=1 Tax=Solea solea TaxID=90069 RepID=UPI00272B8CF7|nr:uncharacterized protein LOC131457015 [Solea solea]